MPERSPDELAAMTNLGIEPVCFDCPYLRTIESAEMYRCEQFAFQRIHRGECEEKAFPPLTMEQAVDWHKMAPRFDRG